MKFRRVGYATPESRNFSFLNMENLPNEEWRPVVGYEGLYEVSNMGRVKSLARVKEEKKGHKYKAPILMHLDRVLKQGVYKTGYHYVNISKGNGVMKKYKVHRLVAIAFIPNPHNKPHVEHKDTVRNNNRLDNLIWATLSENMNNPITKIHHRESKLGDKNPRKAVRRRFVQICLITGNVIAEHLGVRETAIRMGFQSSGLTRCLNGIVKQAHGYKWEYVTG